MERFSNNESNVNHASKYKMTHKKARAKKGVSFRNNLKTFHNIPMNNINIALRKSHKKGHVYNDFSTLTNEEKNIIRNAYFGKELTSTQIRDRMQMYVQYLESLKDFNKNRVHLSNEERNWLNTYL